MASSSTDVQQKLERLDINTAEVTAYFTEGSVIVLDGNVFVFGASLRVNARYRFVDKSITLVCRGRCRLDISGVFTLKCPRTIDNELNDLHAILELKRLVACGGEGSAYGPTVLLVGDKDTGKSTACRTLANLSQGCGLTRAHHHRSAGQKRDHQQLDNADDETGVAFVDLDVGQNAVSCPGSIATAFLEAAVPVDDDFATVVPLCFFFGEKTVQAPSRKRYLDMCAWTFQSIRSVQNVKPKYRRGGVIINTMGWIRDFGYDLIKQIISIFEVTDVVITAANNPSFAEQLRSDFSFAGNSLDFHELKAARTVIAPRTGLDRVRTRSVQIASYFQGTLRTPLVPVRTVVLLKDVHLIDAATLEDVLVKDLRPLTLAAVSTAPNRDLCASSNVAGFVIITDIGKQTLTILSPAPGKLPRPFLLVARSICSKTEDIPAFGA